MRSVLDMFNVRRFRQPLTAALTQAKGCEATSTFDGKAARLDGFVLVR